MRLFDMDSREDYLLDGRYKVATPYAPGVDVVEAVRCKDCKQLRVRGEGLTHWYGCLWRGSCNEDDFCNYGERAEK